MKTVFVSGSDTDVGKTWVVGAIAALLTQRGCSVQVVKPIETGVIDPLDSDAQVALEACANGLASGHTLFSFRLPIAPVAAAESEGRDLDLDCIVKRIEALPDVDWRIIEGAGSLASPIDRYGSDWADFAAAMNIERTVLVVEDRVGAIGQARMLYAYAKSKGLKSGVWLNEIREQDDLARAGTFQGISSSGIPLWATQRRGSRTADILESDWL